MGRSLIGLPHELSVGPWVTHWPAMTVCRHCAGARLAAISITRCTSLTHLSQAWTMILCVTPVMSYTPLFVRATDLRKTIKATMYVQLTIGHIHHYCCRCFSRRIVSRENQSPRHFLRLPVRIHPRIGVRGCIVCPTYFLTG